MAAKVTFKGYVSEKPAPSAKESKGGKAYRQYVVNVRTGKDKQTGKNQYAYFNCRDFRDGAELPAAKAFVEVTGGLSVSTNEKNGKTYTNLDVFVDSLTVAPPRDGEAEKLAESKKDPWED